MALAPSRVSYQSNFAKIAYQTGSDYAIEGMRMAWTKQTFSTVVRRGEFYSAKDGTEGELSKGDTDGQLYIRIYFPATEHGKQSPPVSMQLKNWERISNNIDHIDNMTNKARASEQAIRQIEAENVAYKADMTRLNEARKAFPQIVTEEKYNAECDIIRQKYPALFPALRRTAEDEDGTATAAEMEGETN